MWDVVDMTFALSNVLVVEVVATGCGLAYTVLLIRERIVCWPFAIVGALLSISLFVHAKLYAQAGLYLFYVGAGVWGWMRWDRRGNDNPVIVLPLRAHAAFVVAGAALAFTVAWALHQTTDAARPYIDALTTTFSLVATYLEVKKALEAWMYWLAINLVSIWLYQDRELDIYAGLIAVYAALSAWGLYSWRRTYRGQQ